MPESERPNILLIMSDQHRRAITGCYGDSVVRTPNLDALAGRGVTFDNAYCDFPLCSPTRMSFMTGRLPYEIGAWMNTFMLPSYVPTFAHGLGAVGYETVLCGRMHFNGPDQRHGFQSRVFPEVSGSSMGMLRGANEFNRASIDKSGPGRNHYLLYDQECATAACDWLRTHAGRSDRKPFCLVVGLVGPHCPFVCPEEEFARYFDAVSVPEYSDEFLKGLHPFHRRYRSRSGIDNLTAQEIRRTLASYYGMIDFDDRLIGNIVETLDQSGAADRTVVIYVSDHGDMAGDHGMWWKMSFFEGSAGVPLIVSWPGRFRSGVRERTPVTLADLAPTLAALGGAPPIPEVRRPGLVDYLVGENSDPERAVFSEMIPNMTDTLRMPDQGPTGGPARMMRKGDWKCNYYDGEEPELFNLAEDPGELRNRADDPACRAVRDVMLGGILADWDPEIIRAEFLRLAQAHAYVRKAPRDHSVFEGESWQGPPDYGFVRPV